MCYSIEGFREILKRKFPLESLNLSPIIIINREEKGEKAGEFLKSSLPDATFMKVAKTRILLPLEPVFTRSGSFFALDFVHPKTTCNRLLRVRKRTSPNKLTVPFLKKCREQFFDANRIEWFFLLFFLFSLRFEINFRTKFEIDRWREFNVRKESISVDNNKPRTSNYYYRYYCANCAITREGERRGRRIVAVCCLFMRRETDRPVITGRATNHFPATRCRIVDLGGKYIIARSLDNWPREISITGTLKLAIRRSLLNWARPSFEPGRGSSLRYVFTLQPISPISCKTRAQIYVD